MPWPCICPKPPPIPLIKILWLLWHSFCFNTEKYWQGCVWSGYLLSKWLSITIYIIMFVNLLLSSCLLNVYYGMWFSPISIFVREMSFWVINFYNWELYYLMRCFLWESVLLGGICMAFEKYRLYGVDSSYRNYQGVSFCMVLLHACMCNVHGQHHLSNHHPLLG